MNQVNIITFSILSIWLGILTVAFFLHKKFFKDLTRDLNKKGLIKILGQILKKQEQNDKSIAALDMDLNAYIKEGVGHVQKFSLVRFNPFDEIGGDHSFSIALLNGKDDGILITGLHTRERTRVYSKPVEGGKSKLSLSKEEQQALNKAIKQT